MIRAAYCPGCRESVTAFDDTGRCGWCGEQTGGGAAAPDLAGRHSNAGKPFLMSEETLLRARELYASGLSIRAVARELHHETAYASPKSLTQTLFEQFRLRGWALRSKGAVTAARNFRHGLAGRDCDQASYKRVLRASRSRPCAGVRLQAPRKGSPCRARAMEGSDYCQAHDPARAESRDAQLAAMRARVGRAA